MVSRGKTFQGETTEKLYKTPSGKLTTPFGDLGVTEESVLKERDQRQKQYEKGQSIKAKKYLQDFGKDFGGNEVERGILSKTYDALKTIYVASPFGVWSGVERKEDIKRKYIEFDPSFLKIGGINILTMGGEDAYKLVTAEREERIKGEEQIKLINLLAEKTEDAPEDLQYFVQQEGMDLLKTKGITTKEEEGKIIFFSKELEQKVSFAGSEIVKDQPLPVKISKGVLFGGIKAGEFFIGGKGIGKVAGTLVKPIKYVFKGSKFAGSSTPAVLLRGTVKGGVVVGVGGLYTVGKVKQYGYYKDLYGEAGKEVFAVETAGELVGISALVRGSIVQRRQSIKLQQKQIKINYVKQQRAAELKNIRDFGQYTRRAKLSYKQVGKGKQVLTDRQIKSLAKEYSKITEVSDIKKTVKMIKEQGIYKQTLAIKSNVPSYERLLKYIRTGKAPKTTTQYYETGRYGLFGTMKTPKASGEIAIDFTARGSRVSNVILKLTRSEGKFAVTNVFEKTRYSPKSPLKELRLKQIILTKITKVQQAKKGEAILKAFNLENRLLKTFPYGKERLTFKEAFKIGKLKYSEKDLLNYWKKVGRVGKISQFENIRVETPIYKDIYKDKTLKILMKEEGAFLSGQAGRGKPFLPTKNIEIKNILKNLKTKKILIELEGSQFKVKSGSQTIAGSSTKNVGKAVEQILKSKSETKLIKQTEISKTITSFDKIRVVEKLSAIPKISTRQTSAQLSALLSGSVLKQKGRSKLKQQLRQKQQLKQESQLKDMLKQELRLRQVTQQKQQLRQKSISQLTSQLMGSPIRTPTIAEIKTPISPKIVLPPFATGRGKLKKLIKQKRPRKKKPDAIYYLPDFTSRAIGFDPIDIKSVEQAMKLLRKKQTGLEIRRGVKLRLPQ